MEVTKFIAKNCVIPEMSARNKSDAIKELTHLLFKTRKVKEVGLALDQIVAREATESTGIGNGIAVPHARIPGMKTLSCAVGIAPNGLDFLAIDRKPVQIVFLICYPPSQQTTYLNFVATLAKLLSDEKKRKAIIEAGSADDVFDTLERVSQTFEADHEKAVKQVKADPAISGMKDSHADLILLARLQLAQEMHNTAKTGKKAIQKRMETIRSLVEPRILKHYDKLMSARAPALVPVEGDTCQGCFIRLPSQFVQQVRLDTDHIHTCSNCARYIYVV